MVKLICIDGTIECNELMKKCFELIRNITTDIKNNDDGIPLSEMKITCDEMKKIVNMYTTGELVNTVRIRELLEYLGSIIRLNYTGEQKSVIEQLIDNEDIELLKCCVENGLPITKLCKWMCITQYAREDDYYPDSDANPYEEKIVQLNAYGIAVNNGKMNVLKYLDNINIHLTDDDLIYNSYIGNANGLQYMLENNDVCYINKEQSNGQCTHVNLDHSLIRSLCILEYAILYDPYGKCDEVIRKKDKYLEYETDNDLARYAAYIGNMEMLKRIMEKFGNTEVVGNYACDGAAYGGKLECLKWLHENNYFWNDSVYFYAIKRGHELYMMTCYERTQLIETVNIRGCIAYAYKHNCPNYESKIAYKFDGQRKYEEHRVCEKCKEIHDKKMKNRK